MTSDITVNFTHSNPGDSRIVDPGLSIVVPSSSGTATITVTVTDNATIQNDLSYTITLAAGTGYTVGTPSSATVDIYDDEVPGVLLAAQTATCTEGGAPGIARFARYGNLHQTTTVAYTVFGTAVSADYTALPAVVFADGATRVDLLITALVDAIREDDESVIVNLGTDASYTRDADLNSATITIYDSFVPLIGFFNVDNIASEATPASAGTVGSFLVTRYGNLHGTTAVSYTISGGSTSDFVAFPSITFADGESSKTVIVTPIDDAVAEIDETISFIASASLSYQVDSSAPSASVKIFDNDKPVVSIAPSSNTTVIYENNGPGAFLVTRVGTLVGDLTVNYTRTTGGNSATPVVDYEATPGFIVIPSGSATAWITIVLVDDDTAENDKSLGFTISPLGTYTIGTGTATATLIDDDPNAVAIGVTGNPVCTEGSTVSTFTLTRIGNIREALVVGYSTTSSTASLSDYTSVPSSITFPSDSATVSVVITPVNDTEAEYDETVVFTLTSSRAYQFNAGANTSSTITIRDNDTPLVSLSIVDPTASESGPDSGKIRLTRIGNLLAALTVNFSITGSATAVSGQATAGVIPVNAQSVDVTITPKDDGSSAGDTELDISVVSSANYTISSSSFGVINVIDKPTISIAAVTTSAAVEGTPGSATPRAFRVTRTGTTTLGLTVNLAVSSSSTATIGTDYTALATAVLINPTSASVLVTVNPVGDTLGEDDEVVVETIAASAANYYVSGSANSASITIHDDDSNFPTVSLAVTNATAKEPSGLDPAVTGSFTLTRHAPSFTSALTVNYSIQGSATGNKDYTLLPGQTSTSTTVGSIVFPAGVTTATIVVTPLADTTAELNETVTLALSANAAYFRDTTNNAGTVTIQDGNIPTVNISGATTKIKEGSTVGTFTIQRVGTVVGALTVTYTITGSATVDQDFSIAGLGTVVIPDGQKTATVTVSPLNLDTIAENNETINLFIPSSSAYNLGTPVWASMTIEDDDPAVLSVVATDPTAVFPSNPATFTVTRTGSLSASLTFSMNYSGSTATNGVNFTGATTSSIAVNSDHVLVSVTPLTAGVTDSTIVLNLASNGSGLYAVDSVAPSASADLVLKPTISISATTPTAAESAEPEEGAFTLSRTGTNVNYQLTVFYDLVNPDTGDKATPGIDYQQLSGAVSFAAGDATVILTVVPVNDAIGENTEYVVAQIRTDANYTVSSESKASVAISDDDPAAVSVTATTGSSRPTEGSNGSFTFARTGDSASAGTINVNFSVAGVALAGTDYVLKTSGGSTITIPVAPALPSVAIPAGQASASVIVSTITDTVREAEEAVTLTVKSGNGYNIGSGPTATVTIQDNNAELVQLLASDPSATEAGTVAGVDSGSFTVKRLGNTTDALTVSFIVSGSTNVVGGTDYISNPTITGGLGTTGSVVIPSGSASATIVLTPIDNATSDPDRILTLTITDNAGSNRFFYTADATSKTASINILDGDAPTVSISTGGSDLTASQPASNSSTNFDLGRVLVTRVGSKANVLTVNYTISGSATGGVEYVKLGTGTSASIAIPKNAASATIVITPTLNATSSKTVDITLVTTSAYTIAAPISTSVTVLPKNTVTISAAATALPNVFEPSVATSTNLFTVTRAGGPSSDALVVSYSVSGSSSLVAGKDYTSPGTAPTVTIPAGATTANLALTLLPDTVGEDEKTLTVNLTSTVTSLYSLGATPSATVLVDDSSSDTDKPTVSISVSVSSTAEADPSKPAQFIVTRATGNSSADLTVKVKLTGSAINGVDYVLVPGTVVTASAIVTIPATSKSATVLITPIGNDSLELDETVTLTLDTSATNFVGNASALAGTVTIYDNGVPQVTVAAALSSISEGDAAKTAFVVTRKGSGLATLTVSYGVTGSATAGVDYVTLPGSVVIPAGALSAAIVVTPNPGVVSEPIETIVVTLVTSSAYVFPTAVTPSATVNLNDDDPCQVFITLDTDAQEPNLPGKFLLRRLGRLADPLTVTYALSGTAAVGADYVTPSATVILAANVTVAALVITPVPDALVESTETIVATLNAGSNYTVNGGAAVMNLFDLPIVAISNSANATEGTSLTRVNGSFTITRTPANGPLLTVLYTVAAASSSATADVDFEHLSGQIVLAAGVSTATIVVTPKDDSVGEDDETFTLALTTGTPAAYTISSSSYATITLHDDSTDLPSITISATTPQAVEPDTNGEFTLTRHGNQTGAFTVYYAVASGNILYATPNSDYVTLPGQVAFSAGVSTATITVTPKDDTATEGSELITVNLSGDPSVTKHYVVGSPVSSTVTLIDNESATVTIVTQTTPAKEPTNGGSTGLVAGKFLLTRIGRTDNTLTVSYTVTGSASSTDYEATPAFIVFAPGASTCTITITPTDDSATENDETVVATLTSASASVSNDYKLGAGVQASLKIQDNDGFLVSISATTPRAYEVGGSGKFTISRIGTTSVGLTINYVISSASTAIRGTDYTSIPASAIAIAVGQSDANIIITGISDNLSESDETVKIDLAAGSYTVTGSGTATVTIVERPLIGLSDPLDASEGGAQTGSFTINRSGPTDNALTVRYTVAGTATAGSDYITLSGVAVINATSSSAVVTVTPLDDTTGETDETVVVTLSTNTAYGIISSQSSTTVTILEDDTDAPTITLSAVVATVTEGGGAPGQFRITRGAGSGNRPALTVFFTLSGTPTSGNFIDFDDVGTSVVIPQDETEAIVYISTDLATDTIAENDETLTMTIKPDSTYVLGKPIVANITIIDNDLPSVSIQTQQATNAEESVLTQPNTVPIAGQFIVTRVGNRASPLVVSFSITGNASAGTDYVAVGSSVVIPVGLPNASIYITPINDFAAQNDRLVIATLTGGSYTPDVRASQATVTILDDDPASVSITLDRDAAEPSSVGRFLVTRVGRKLTALAVAYHVSDSSTATSGTDYTALPGVVTIPAQSSTAYILVTPKLDTDGSSDETVVVRVDSGTGYIPNINQRQATMTIVNNDPPSIDSFDATGLTTGTNVGKITIAVSDDGDALDLLKYKLTALKQGTTAPATIASGNIDPDGAATPTVTFAVAGTYDLTLTIIDGALTTTQVKTVTVAAP